MALLNPHRSDRAQLLLVGAIGLALLLVVLAVMLNTAIYTEAISSGAASAYDERAAITYVDAVDSGVLGIMMTLNAESNGTATQADLKDTFEKDIQEWNEITGAYAARDGVMTDVAVDDIIPGTRIVQDGPRNFSNASGVGEWTLTDDAETIPEFWMNVSADSLHTPENGTCESSDACFEITVTDDNGTVHQVYLSQNESENVTVEIQPPTHGWDECSTDDAVVEIDFVEGTVDGDRCNAVAAVLDGTPPVTISFENADNVSGTYALTIDGETAPAADFDETGSPRTAPAIVGAELTVAYRSSTLTYVGTIEVEPDG